MTNTGTEMVFYTNKDAPNYRVVVIDLKDSTEDKWNTLIEVKHKKYYFVQINCHIVIVSNVGTPNRCFNLDAMCG